MTLNNAVLAVGAIIMLSWLWGTISAIEKNFLLQQEAENLQQQVALQQLKNQNLTYQQHYYQSAEFLDLQAREHFNLASPGESVIILPANTVSSKPKATPVQTPVPQRSNFEQWLYFFFGDKS